MNIRAIRYRFVHWFFRWNKDKDGDIVFSVAGVLHFVKYKEHTMVKWGRQRFERARKWQGYVEPVE